MTWRRVPLQEAIRFTARRDGRDKLVKHFALAIAPFSPGHYIGDDKDGAPMARAALAPARAGDALQASCWA